jgi:hypothetical protein
LSRNQDNICADCNHCFPDKEGPTSYGICLLDLELEPFEEEILELDFRNCRELVKKKRFDLNHEACSQFSLAEIEEFGDLDETDLQGLLDTGSGQQEANYVRIDPEAVDIEAYCSKLPVQGYVDKLYSSDPKESREALESLRGLRYMGNKAAEEALLEFFKKLGPPGTLEEVKLKIEVFRHLKDLKDNSELVQVLLSDLENTRSNNTTRQWFTTILKALGSTSPEMVQGALEDMLERQIFSRRLEKRIEELLQDLLVG